MFVQEEVTIKASKEKIWKVVSNFEKAPEVFKDIKSIEILEKPKSGLVGLKFKEIRQFMGKEACETMVITEAQVNKSYTTEAKNSGCLYRSSLSLREVKNGVVVSKSFNSTPQSFIAKLMAPVMFLMKGTLKKCIVKDLNDAKSYLESTS